MNTQTHTCIHSQLFLSLGSTFMDCTNHRSCAMFEIYIWLHLQIQNVWVKRAKYRIWECMDFDNCGGPITNLPRDDCTTCRFVLTFTRHSFKYLHTWIHMNPFNLFLKKLPATIILNRHKYSEAQRYLANNLKQEHYKVVVLIISV